MLGESCESGKENQPPPVLSKTGLTLVQQGLSQDSQSRNEANTTVSSVVRTNGSRHTELLHIPEQEHGADIHCGQTPKMLCQLESQTQRLDYDEKCPQRDA